MNKRFFLTWLAAGLILAAPISAQQTGYANPVIPGFYPDPSICRVGEDFYLVNSSFEFFPGVPIFHSRDLVHWNQIGYCLTRDKQLPLQRVQASGGIYAPTIRYHNGVFFMVTTNVNHGGNFFVTATDPAGEWSDPVYLDQGGIDPSLFFDDDGKVYLASNGGPDGIYQSEIDIKTGKRLTDIRHIWSGTGGRYPEGPHLYKMKGYYSLMIAEGGTEYGHMETIARSRSPWGPFESNPGNPILTHRNKINQNNPIQGTGHADMVHAKDGSWWLVCLAFRAVSGNWHHLGRETYMAPVEWNKEGWPVVNKTGSVFMDMKVKTLPQDKGKIEKVRDDFDAPALSLEWNYLRNPEQQNYSLSDRKGWLMLKGTTESIDSSSSPTFIGRRQQHFNCSASAFIQYEPASGNEAGLTCYMSPSHHYEVFIGADDQGKFIQTRYTIGSVRAFGKRLALHSSQAILKIIADKLYYRLLASVDNGVSYSELGKVETRYLSSEVAGGFSGVYFGLYNTTREGVTQAPAYIDWFDYQPTEE